MREPPGFTAKPENPLKRVTGVTELSDLNVFCDSHYIDYITFRVSNRSELTKLGFLPFSRAKELAEECVDSDKILPQFYSLDETTAGPHESREIREWIEHFKPDAIVASHGSNEALAAIRNLGVCLISAREDLSSDMGHEDVGPSIEKKLGRGWDMVDLWVYPDYDNGWDLLLDEYPADLSDLEVLVSRYPVFVSIDISRDNIDSVRRTLSKAVGIDFECKTAFKPFGGNANVFDVTEILEFAKHLSVVDHSSAENP